MTSRLPTWMRCLSPARTRHAGTDGTVPTSSRSPVNLCTTRTAYQPTYDHVDHHHHKYGITVRTYRMCKNYRHRIIHVEENSPFHTKLMRLDIITKVNDNTTETFNSEVMVEIMEAAFSESCSTMRVVRVCGDEVCVKDLRIRCCTDDQEGPTCNCHEPSPGESSPNPPPASPTSPELPVSVETGCDPDLCARECTNCCQQDDGAVNLPTEAIADGEVHVSEKNVRTDSIHNVVSLITERRDEIYINKTYVKCLEGSQYLFGKDENLKLVRNPRTEGDLHDCFFKVNVYVGMKPNEGELVEIFLIESLSCEDHAVGVDHRSGHHHHGVSLHSNRAVMKKLKRATDDTKNNESGALESDGCLFFLNDNCEESEEVLSSTKMKDYYLCASGDDLIVKREDSPPINDLEYRFQFVHPRHPFRYEDVNV